MEQNEIDNKVFVECFGKAMKRIDDYVSVRPKSQTPANRELHRMKAWEPSWIATQYCLIAGGVCTLSRRLRDYITALGEEAKKYYEQYLNEQ